MKAKPMKKYASVPYLWPHVNMETNSFNVKEDFWMEQKQGL